MKPENNKIVGPKLFMHDPHISYLISVPNKDKIVIIYIYNKKNYYVFWTMCFLSHSVIHKALWDKLTCNCPEKQLLRVDVRSKHKGNFGVGLFTTQA